MNGTDRAVRWAEIEQASPVSRARKRAGALSPDRPLLWLGPTVLVLLLLSVFPFLYAVYHSFFEFNPVLRGFRYVGGENWWRGLTEPRVHNALAVTFSYAALALAAELLMGILIAVLFDTQRSRSGVLQAVVLLPMVVPPVIAGLMFQLMEHSEFGIISYVLYESGLLSPREPLIGGTGRYALLGVLLPDLWQWTPFVALLTLAGLRALPREPLEAAAVDGATWWQQLRYVTLPMLRPVIVLAILIRGIDLYRTFDYVYILTSGGPGTKTELLSYYTWLQTFRYIKWGYGSTLGLLTMLTVLILANLYVRVLRVRW